MILVKIYNKMELELFSDNLEEQRIFKNRYYNKMVNFTGSDFGKSTAEDITSYVMPDFICTKVVYDSGKDTEEIYFEKSEVKKSIDNDEQLVSD